MCLHLRVHVMYDAMKGGEVFLNEGACDIY